MLDPFKEEESSYVAQVQCSRVTRIRSNSRDWDKLRMAYDAGSRSSRNGESHPTETQPGSAADVRLAACKSG